jgi:hypothetical protein
MASDRLTGICRVGDTRERRGGERQTDTHTQREREREREIDAVFYTEPPLPSQGWPLVD